MDGRVFGFFFFFNVPYNHELEKIVSEDRINPVPAGCQVPGFEFAPFNPPPNRPRMFMEEVSRFFNRHDIIHLSYSIAQRAREIFLQHLAISSNIF